MFRCLILLFSTVISLLTLTSCAADIGPLIYVSLGDSLAVGVGSSDPQELGYAPLYRDSLSENTGREVRLVQLGLSGETSGSFIGEYPAGGSQLIRAEQVLRRNPGAIVTLSIGGNDLRRVADATDARREAAIARYRRNLDYILKTLKNASGPPPHIIVLALYNPDPSSLTDRWIEQLNADIRAVAEENGVAVAAGDKAFEGREKVYARYDDYPWDIHPTDAGYAALARALEETPPAS